MRTTQVTNIVRKAAKVSGFHIGKVSVVATALNPITGKPSAVPSAQFDNNIYLHYCNRSNPICTMQHQLEQHGLTLVGHVSSVGRSYRVEAL